MRKLFTFFALAIIIFLLGLIIIRGDFPLGKNPDDFFAYWAAGQLLIREENPYSPLNSMQISQELGFENIGLLLSYFYPPWTLPIFIPFAAISFTISRTLWFLAGLLILITSSRWLWDIYGGPRSKTLIPLVLTLCLIPGIFALIEGQVTPIMLLGLTGFLYFDKAERWFPAGVFLAFATFKVHVLYLFWLALILWIVKFRRWGIIFGFLFAISVMTIIALLVDHNVIGEYIAMNRSDLPQYCNNPTLSSIMCTLTGDWNSWYLFLAPIFGLLWLIYYWQRQKHIWNWRVTIGLLVAVSLITSPYVWMHDNLFYLIPAVEILVLFLAAGFSRQIRIVIAVFLIINLIAFALLFNHRIDQLIFIWMPVLFLILYLFSKKLVNTQLSRTENLTISTKE